MEGWGGEKFKTGELMFDFARQNNEDLSFR